jgi:hypothetical protein
MNVKIVYLSQRGREDMEDVIEMFKKDIGPIKFKLIDHTNSSNYFKLHHDLDKVSLEDFEKLSSIIREEEAKINSNDYLVVVTPRRLSSPNKKIKSFKDWISFYDNKNIIVKSSGWDKISEGKSYLYLAHQIIENLFQNLCYVDLTSEDLHQHVHMKMDVCINDFCEKLDETKGKIRSGFICQKCLNHAYSVSSRENIDQIRKILARIGDRIRSNYEFNFSEDDLKIEFKKIYKNEHRKYLGEKNIGFDLYIGGKKIDFGKAKTLKVVYFFYLINHHLKIGRHSFEKKNESSVFRSNYKSLYEQLIGQINEVEINSYIKSMTSYHSRILTTLKNKLQLESLAEKYKLTSKFVEQDKSVYWVEVDAKNIIIPVELEKYRVLMN